MEHYLLFLTMATATVLSPGPGVTLTLTNSLRYGLQETLGGIIGVALGALVVAAISATGVGIILATSALAFTIMKYIGAVYLIYLGVKMWRTPHRTMDETPTRKSNARIRFVEGLSLQLTNPKVIFFFVAIFPQFIDSSMEYAFQFLLLVLTYACLVLAIHLLYAITAKRAKKWLSSPRGNRIVNRLGGGIFVFFGLALATNNK